jgi:hypothetical protein
MRERKFWSAVYKHKWNDWHLAYGDSIISFPIARDLSSESEVLKIVDLLNQDDNKLSTLTRFICTACDVDGPLT